MSVLEFDAKAIITYDSDDGIISVEMAIPTGFKKSEWYSFDMQAIIGIEQKLGKELEKLFNQKIEDMRTESKITNMEIDEAYK